MFATQSSWEDVQKYFGGCFVKFEETGDKLYYIETVDPDKIIARDTKGEAVGIDLSAPCKHTGKPGYKINFVLPKKTVYQYDKIAVMLSRIPQRMWKKGINKQNTQFEILDATGRWSKADFNAQLIESFINKPSYYNVELAHKEFQVDVETCALTPRITYTKTGLIFVDQTIIGKRNLDTNVISVKPLFEPEIKVLFAGYTLKVVK